MSSEMIPFQIETQRVIQLLAKQIYQSPLALLRENTQNAFDAIRLRIAKDNTFSPRIDIELEPGKIVIVDNGVGMTPDDLKEHYWKAGSSSKNNDEARAAGVVGTFGIGAMANFGIARSLDIETESALTGVRSTSSAALETLTLNADCISLEHVPSTGVAGTRITASVAQGNEISVSEATAYIADFVALVDVPVYVNGVLVSQVPAEERVPVVPATWEETGSGAPIGSRLQADYRLVISNNADVWISLGGIVWSGRALAGKVVLRSGLSGMRTYRSGFGLATTSVSSHYQLGGIVDLLILEPTAGREAITTDGMQLIQSIVSEIDAYISVRISELPESDASTPFMSWATRHKRYDLCGNLRMTVSPGERIRLSEVKELSSRKPFLLYAGNDTSVIKRHASDESLVLQLARNNPRRQCEQHYLAKYCRVEGISDNPQVTSRKNKSDLSFAENALAFRLQNILETDYFVRVSINFGQISHALPLMAERNKDGINITLDPSGQSVRLLLGLFDTEYTAFGSMAKDFVRTMVFPRISEFVPSSTRQGAEAFLKAIRRPREIFEYEEGDLESLPVIWEEYQEGKISLEQAVKRSTSAVRSSVQYVDAAVSARAGEVVPDIIRNEAALQADPGAHPGTAYDAAPPITRLEQPSDAKLLTIEPMEQALRGYRCFLAITDRVREEMGEFFLQPHRTSVVWGGQKTLFIFLHHSEEFGLYYELQTSELVEEAAGGGSFPTCTMVLENRIYIPVPEPIRASFVPRSGERKRFEVRADILKTESA